MSKEIIIKRVENGFYIMCGEYGHAYYQKQYCAHDVPTLTNLVGDLAVQLMDEHDGSTTTPESSHGGEVER